VALEVSEIERLLGDEWTEVLPPICLDCGYDLTGLPSRRCPECGNIFIRGEVRQQARRIRNELRQLRTTRDLVRLGWFIGLGTTVAMVGLGLLGFVNRGFASMGAVFGFMAGIPTIGLGLQVLRVLRLPAWARERIEDGPDIYKGVGLAILGLGMMIGSFLLF
jgi:hypothetical protein